MSVIKPFRGFRPPKEIVEKLASRPYDVLNSEEARKECEGNPYSLLHVTKAEIDLPVGTDEHSLEVYLQVVKNYNSFKDYGWLVQDKEEKLYIYAQSMNPTAADAKWQYGIVACAYSEDYVNKIIKKHELTRKDKEEDRMKHVRGVLRLSRCCPHRRNRGFRDRQGTGLRLRRQGRRLRSPFLGD